MRNEEWNEHRDCAGEIESLTRTLNRLIEFAEERDGRRYTNREIAAAATTLGYAMSAAELSHIRLGRVRNPGFRKVEGISLALGVDIRAFLVDPRHNPCTGLDELEAPPARQSNPE
ncbi:hypothetical protein AB0N05_24490 [Nocardia sp. NPDC051030]|uniref:hypothetical protein n=1 Tax=Nocardia sp. NPDC051030 TaxID=3155162 RepID=UPI00341F2782